MQMSDIVKSNNLEHLLKTLDGQNFTSLAGIKNGIHTENE